jgi:hypothetical protein
MTQIEFNYRVSLIEDISKQKKLITGEVISVEEFDYLYDLPDHELENILSIGDKLLHDFPNYEEI